MPLTTGGSDAGASLVPYYKIAEGLFPVLADDVEIQPDTAVGTFGLAWFRGLDTKGTTDPHDDEPRFAVRDDINVDEIPYVPFHESGHAFQETVARLIALERGVEWTVVFDEIRVRYWAFRGFPGTWFEAQLRAIRDGWPYYPDESFADCFAHAVLHLHPIPGYVTGEWTENYNTTPIWQKADQAVAFMRSLANEAQEEELDAEDKATLKTIAKFTEESFNKLNALTSTLVTLLDRLGDGRDVASGGSDKSATKP